MGFYLNSWMDENERFETSFKVSKELFLRRRSLSVKELLSTMKSIIILLFFLNRSLHGK